MSCPTGQNASENITDILKEAFANLAENMNTGFSSLGVLIKNQDQADEMSSDSEIDEHNDSASTEPPAAKRQKADDSQNSPCEEHDILSNLAKQYSTTDQEGPGINTSLADIVKNLLTEKADDDKLTELRKRYGKP